ncbi:hypothetical protein [Candidatus Villigracilis saccharophilus]|uniref:hypothetical protein n=1 Tax=Candidatus Villigracilis saccharophilus TaxID=3140684 RepID=UPI0031369F17|nr:hypothetical protein [Anaerolineales bacterium]
MADRYSHHNEHQRLKRNLYCHNGPAPWNPYDPNDIVADFDLQGYDIQAGDVITASGNGMTNSYSLPTRDHRL